MKKLKVKIVYTLDPTGMSLDNTLELEIILKDDEIENCLYCNHDKSNRFYELVRNTLSDTLMLKEWEKWNLHIWKIYLM
jgi:hypothetical protein